MTKSSNRVGDSENPDGPDGHIRDWIWTANLLHGDAMIHVRRDRETWRIGPAMALGGYSRERLAGMNVVGLYRRKAAEEAT